MLTRYLQMNAVVIWRFLVYSFPQKWIPTASTEINLKR